MQACGPYGPRGFESLSRRQLLINNKVWGDELNAKVTLIAISIFMLLMIFPIPVRAAPSLRTGQPLYTLRDSQVTLVGSGYANQIYYIWIQDPSKNNTVYSGINFLPISGGVIGPNVGLPISSDMVLGTYLVSISTSSTSDNKQAVAHFGVWGTSKPLFQRTEPVRIVGGGLFPGTSFKLSLRDPSGNYVVTPTIVAAANGAFNYTWRIPINGVTETYKILIDGTGTFDNAQQDYLSEARFSVTPATLSVSTIAQPSSVHERTQSASTSYSIAYPDGTPVVTEKASIQPVLLMQNQSTVAFASLVLVDQANGIWQAQARLPVNSTLSSNYRFDLPSSAFDDGFGNTGSSSDTLSNYFRVTNASLVISSSINGTQIQVPFGQISVISKIEYPDGTPLTNGTTMVSVTGSSSSGEMIKLSYDSTISAWRASYSSAFSDIGHIGTWTLQVEAYDEFGNSGSATYEVSAQPYLFISIVGSVAVVLVFGRWIMSRFGRRAYFRVRKIMRRIRDSSSVNY